MRYRRRSRLFAIPVALVVTSAMLSACGSSGGRSEKAFCRDLRVGEKQLNGSAASAGPGLGSQLGTLAENIGRFTSLLHHLDAEAPAPIEIDMHDVRTNWDSQKEEVEQAASNPLGALAGALVGGLLNSAAIKSVDSYSQSHCGTQLFGTAPSASGQTSSAPAPSDAANPSEVPEAAPSSAPPSLPPVTPGVGKIVMDQDHVDAVCASAVSGTSGDVPDSSVAVLPGGKAVIACTGEDASGNSQATLVSYDLLTQQQGWTYTVPAGSQYSIGTQHVIELDPTNHPAAGLQDAYTTYRLVAIDLGTGAVDWSAPFETWLKPSSDDDSGDDGDFSVIEGPSGDSSHPTDVVVSFNDTAAFDSATGMLLWHTGQIYDTPAAGSYITDGIVEVADYSTDENGDTDDVAGLRAATGKQVWGLNFPDWFEGNDGADDVYGTTELRYADVGYYEYDVATGHEIGSAQFPDDWSNVVMYPGYVTTQIGSTLYLYRTSNLKTPAWSDPASSDVSVVAATAGHLLVSAPSGYLILDTADGSTTTTLSAADLDNLDTSSPSIVDGMVYSGDTVLELDPPKGN